MRLLVLSDLHLEYWRDDGPGINLGQGAPDAVILAGDIASGANGVAWATDKFAGLPVLYVHGNHEAYGKNLEMVQEDIQKACAASGHVHFLNGGEFHLADLHFLGATLWTDFRLFSDQDVDRRIAMSEAEQGMNDYHRIRLAGQGYRKLRAADTAQIHADQRTWLAEKLHEGFTGKTVVITHMAPSARSVPAEYATDPISVAYASRLDALAGQADLWVHGHQHTSLDYRIGQCRVVCNPRGYMNKSGGSENQLFNPNLIVEI
jgi:predicted phosphodiesterase